MLNKWTAKRKLQKLIYYITNNNNHFTFKYFFVLKESPLDDDYHTKHS